MEKELLHKFFAGAATLEEKEAIMHWMESDPGNKQFLLKERKLYNAVLLHGEDKQVQQQAGRQQYFLRRGVARFLIVAAMIVVDFGLGYLWQ